MKRIKVYINYKHIAEPWGGANNFIRALHREMSKNDEFEIVENIQDDHDILFLNELGMGPALGSRRMRFRSIEKIRKNFPSRKIVVRAVNIKRHAYEIRFWRARSYLNALIEDKEKIRLLNMADFAIFQSGYQRDIFRKYGYRREKNAVIHNGADEMYANETMRQRPLGEKLKLVSSTATARPSKRHDLIAGFSEQEHVEIIHTGVWPENVDKKNVVLKGMVSCSDIVGTFREAHYFLHPAVKDPCPNAVFEAISCGLPVIFNPGPGSSAEIVRENGFPLNEGCLAETSSEARIRYGHFMKSIDRSKEYYSIRRAAGEYMDLFRSLAG